MAKKNISNYQGSAGGWGALASTSKHLFKSKRPVKNIISLLKTNQHLGFDCPGCAWGDAKGHSVSFCENGAKAVNWEATAKKVSADFFAKYTVSYLETQSDYFLEYQGRLTQPMSYNSETDHSQPISWQDAFDLIASHLNALQSSDQAEFYTSGRASNEAAFIYQLFVRSFGTNNFPDCSNMCHEASGVAMKESIGIGKGTVTLEDFELADAIFVFGQNPGTNHPRMLETLRQASVRGATVVSFNNLRERGLERFTNPQSPVEMLTNGHTKISKHYYTPRLGGDMALVRGIVKALLQLDKASIELGKRSLLDLPFLQQHTSGLDEYLALVESSNWQQLEEQSGICKTDMQEIAEIYARSERVICSWAMGLTQHKHSVITLQEILNLLLLRGNIGKSGAGACPVRGHSNVQGDRTMGIDEKAPSILIDNLERVFATKMPRKVGHNAIQAVEAMLEGRSKVFIALGGNFAAAMADTQVTRKALSNCELVVNISTKLNRSHLSMGKNALILPCLGRTELDMTEHAEQRITVEDSMCMVHSSGGVLTPASKELKSEVSIIANIAATTLPEGNIDWLELATDYEKIRDLIEQCIPGFHDFNSRIKQPGGFYLGNSAAARIWMTETKLANIKSNPLPERLIAQQIAETKRMHRTQLDQHVVSEQGVDEIFTLQTLRSHDQYNTTIYGFNDRYRGVKGLRKVLFMHWQDMQNLDLDTDSELSITSHWLDGSERSVSGFKAVAYDIPRGNMAAYYPETNPLVPLASYGDRSFTPTSKAIAISVKKQSHSPLIKLSSLDNS
ncbi:MAG: oxidoreductase alpha (molybdopterin) subunit [Osedax symbiont Rs2]|nr:MAG: oxidoreductase alpha (molybdopterin) subunit [Osedax symbiont Rs2]